MCFGDIRGGSLTAMTDNASKSIDRVRDRRVFAEGLLIYIAKTCFVQPKVTCRAAIDDTQFRKPDLMNARLETATKAYCISSIVDQRQVVALIAMPRREVIFGWSNCESQQ